MIIFTVSDLGILMRVTRYYFERYEDVLSTHEKKQLNAIIEKIQNELSSKGYLVDNNDHVKL